MDLRDVGMSGGSGLLGALLTFFGLKARMDELKQELEKKVHAPTCEAIQKHYDERHTDVRDALTRIENKLDKMISKGG